jgi:hypothetical protein
MAFWFSEGDVASANPRFLIDRQELATSRGKTRVRFEFVTRRCVKNGGRAWGRYQILVG